VGHAVDALDVLLSPLGVVHGLSTRLQLGPVRRDADSSTYPQAGAVIDANTLAQGTHGRLRRWIMLRCVDWLPPDFTASRSWPFSSSRDRCPGCPLGDSPGRRRYSRNKGSPHRPRMP
jgi:hypothetical protein